MKKIRSHMKHPGEGRLNVTCWCGRYIDDVSTNDVANGRTFSCGRTGCGSGIEGVIT